MKKKLFIPIGVFALGLYIVLNRYTETPELILGLLLGLSICFNLFGLLTAPLIKRLKWNKHHLINK